MPKANLSLKIIPVVPPDHIYPMVDKVIELIKESGLNHVVGPSETTIEGELEELLEIAKQAHYLCISEGASRVLAIMQTDYSAEGVTIDEKIAKYR